MKWWERVFPLSDDVIFRAHDCIGCGNECVDEIEGGLCPCCRDELKSP